MALEPGATYIYEKVNGVTYARKFGETIRTPIGEDFDTQLRKEMLWKDIHREAETNIALQHALDRVIMIYRLSKDNPI